MLPLALSKRALEVVDVVEVTIEVAAANNAGK
jgi:hypothetical protein